MRLCRSCNEMKAGDQFYAGRATCKACVIARVRNAPNRDAVQRAYHHRHKARLNAARVERQRGEDGSRQARWAQTPAGKRSRADSSSRRRARKLGNGHEKYDRMDVFVRDAGICHLCEAAVDPSIQWPDLAAFSIDHVIPLSKDGPDAMWNVVTSHLGCNIAKGARMEKVS